MVEVTLAFTFDLGESNPTLKKYIDGVKVEEQALGSGQDGRWSIDSDAGFLVLADENREINPGYSSSIFFSDRIFPDEEIQALGTPDADGVINTPTSNQASQFDFTNQSLTPTFGPGQFDYWNGDPDSSTWLIKGTVASRPIPILLSGCQQLLKILKLSIILSKDSILNQIKLGLGFSKLLRV